MKALVLQNPGSNPTLGLQEVARPEPGPGEVLVRVAAAGLNFRDLLMAKNHLPGASDFIAGGDAAGVVAAVGAGVSRWLPGARVVLHPDRSCGDCEYCQSGRQYFCEQRRSLGYALDGTFAEYVRVPGPTVSAMPDHLRFTDAAALPVAFGTAWNVMVTEGEVKPGDTVLIHGVGGGVALFCLQIAVGMGARAIVTSGSDQKLARATALGAAETINYRREDVRERVIALTAGRGVDLAVDGVGKETLLVSLEATHRTGRVVRFGAVTGGVDVPMALLTKQLRSGHMASLAEWHAALRFVANTRFKPVVDRVFGLADWAEAYRYLEQQEQFGKVVIRISEARFRKQSTRRPRTGRRLVLLLCPLLSITDLQHRRIR